MGASIWWAAYEADTQFTIFDLSALKKQCLIFTNKYILHFSEPARKINPIKLVPKGKVKAPQNSRYTSLERLTAAKTLD